VRYEIPSPFGRNENLQGREPIVHRSFKVACDFFALNKGKALYDVEEQTKRLRMRTAEKFSDLEEGLCWR
jgi:hypothetical protein